MKERFQKFLAWQRTRQGLVVSLTFDVCLAYLFASWAIDSGSLFDYTITFLLAVLIVQDLIALFRLTTWKKGTKK
jgi:uncharacterized membrane protein YidH (DUF202 family)